MRQLSQETRNKLSLAGKKGYAATVAKYGKDFALQHVANYHRDNPSNLEQAVMQYLDKLGVQYLREEIIEGFIVDFLIDNYVVEVNGEVWHQNNFAGNRKERDRKKYRTLANAGYTVVIIPEKDVDSGKYKVVLDKLFKGDMNNAK